MKRWQFSLALAGAALVAVLAGFATYSALPKPGSARFHGTTYQEVAPAADFRLTDQDGRAVTLESYRGTPVLLFFGYTQCPDICPLTLDQLARAIRAAGDDARDTRVLLVTVDPERDTPAALKAYVARFGPRVSGLTGDSASLAEAWRGYGVYVNAESPPAAAAHDGHAGEHGAASDAAKAPQVAHSGVVYGIDREGRLQVVISDRATPEQTRDDVRTLSRL
ncbi:MAG TPA: SCO family protein [Longimicrobium sp.]|nr:SCO family protein [Longimicrobium sp.]